MEREKIEKIIFLSIEEVLGRKVSFDLSIDLTSEGLDSLNVVELVMLIEESFEIEFMDEDMLLQNFTSIDSIYNVLTKYISREATSLLMEYPK